MTKRKWGLITSGATFEALVTTLIFFEDPKAALFGRRGKDGGQDARSGDGLRVFQAKHHEDGSATKAITDAKSEAAKIAEYRKPEHARHLQWKGVTHWRLVTNAVFNPADKQRWDAEVVPLFLAQGLNPDYWERANLDGLLDKHPEVERSFFENETRVFLSLPEIRERLPEEDPFLRRETLTTFRGREAEAKDVRSFLLSDALFLVVHGEGGIGKTRLLVEAGDEIASEGEWQVFWANVASMASSSTWFDSIVSERTTLLLVDEPDDPQLLRILSEQLGSRFGRTAKWKVAISVRSPKNPVLRYLFSPRVKERVQELQISELAAVAAEEMCFDLLSSGPLGGTPNDWRKDAARKLAARFSNRPIWLTLAVHVLEVHGDLAKVPATAADLADLYVSEIIKLQQDANEDQVHTLLQYIALLGTINREDKATLELLRGVCKIDNDTAVLKLLADLVKRRGLTQRGAEQRLVELKPDVLRDHILLSWLSVDIGYGATPIQPSEDAKNIVIGVRDAVLKGSISALGRTILTSLARTEFLLRLSGKAVPLLDPLFTGILAGLAETTASQRLIIAEVLQDFAAYRPPDTVEISRALRSSIVKSEKTEGYFGSREIGQDDIVMALAWPIFHAAMGAQSANDCVVVLKELCILAELEAEVGLRRTGGLPNDGKRAGQLIGRTIGGGPHFSADFTEAASTISYQLLEEIINVPATPAKGAVVKALLEPTLSVERQQTYSEGFTIHFSRMIILPSHPAWKKREMLLTRLKDILKDADVPSASRNLLWSLYAEAHRTVNYCIKQVKSEESRKQMRQVLLEDLVWAYPVLSARKDNLAELMAARDLWNWHYRFDDDPEFKKVSTDLEALYDSNSLSSEFDPLTNHDKWEQQNAAYAAKAEALAAGKPGGIDEFLSRAVSFFLGNENELYHLHGVALKLGELATSSKIVRDFVYKSLAEPKPTSRTEFAIDITVSWIASTRKETSSASAFQLILELMKMCGSDEQRIRFILRQYARLRLASAQIENPEYDFIRSLSGLFLEQKEGAAYIEVIGWTFTYKWLELKALIDAILDRIEPAHLAIAIRNLVDTIYYAVREKSPAPQPPDDLGQWFLNQLIRLPKLDDIGANADWYIEDLFKRIGRVHLSWLPGALEKRRAMEAADESHVVRAISHHPKLSSFVAPVTIREIANPDNVNAIKSLADMLLDKTVLGYYMPEILHDVDPEGLLVPDEIVSRLSTATTRDDVWCFARVAGTYDIGSTSWRKIARPVVIRANKAASDEERRDLFVIILHHGMKSWSGTPGQVPQLFIDAVNTARTQLDSETDTAFRPFWEWNLAIAEAELKAQEEQAKEMRGE
ncbi:MAG TPA: hypothetical protein VL197_01030 [Nitrospirota bacterium]|nr:hypothetical protein [Nitrospirota bacterium]